MFSITEVVREETYTFTPNDGSEEIHILSGRLRKWLLANAKDKVIELTFPEQTLDDIIERHGLEQHRLESMTLLEASEPVIVGLYPNGTHILIDGGHRRYYWAKRGVDVLKGWAVPEDIWREFVFDPNGPNVLYSLPNGLTLQQRIRK